MSKALTDFSLDVFSLEGKIAMITGANQGLGMAYAVALAKAGADLYIPHFTDDVSEVRELIEGIGRKAVFLQGDLTNQDYRKTLVNDCIDKYGRIDVLINNAGTNFAAPLLEYPDEKWTQVMDLQLNAVQFLSHEVAPIMVKNGGGKIINIASALSFASDAYALAYTTAKHAIVGLTRSYAAELGKYNVQCNAIAPGFFATDMNASVREKNPTVFKKVSDRIPNNGDGWGDIYDLMGTAVFLSSAASDYISGWILNVDGGFKAVMV